MYNVIQLTEEAVSKEILESVNPEKEDTVNTLYTEAVFVDGKKSVESIVKYFKAVKDVLDERVKEQEESDNSGKASKDNKNVKFDPIKYWRDPVWKDLENEIRKIFGFRNVEIHPFKEKYNSKTKLFESKELNACVYNEDRFPIDGLISDKGFYDKTHSINVKLYFTLGIIKELTDKELLAVLLHEFGHAIDPALVNISYTQTNILTKYITDRVKNINNAEKRLINKLKKKYPNIFNGISPIIIGVLIGILILPIPSIIESIRETIIGKDKAIEEKMNKVRKIIQKDKSEFNRQTFSEAFADNFARMYGYGPQLASALNKFDKNTEMLINSRFKKEKMRQQIILSITSDLMNDMHKTDVHRIRNLINEYKNDIADPNTCPEVKKQLQEDLVELEKVFDAYLNNFSEFQNRVNKTINDELQKKEDEKSKTSSDDEKDKAIKEGVEFFQESRKAYEKLMKAKNSLTPEERSEAIKVFGQSKECSFAKDKDGYYCFTHRCRSKSYPSISEIPQSKVAFVRSTS